VLYCKVNFPEIVTVLGGDENKEQHYWHKGGCGGNVTVAPTTLSKNRKNIGIFAVIISRWRERKL